MHKILNIINQEYLDTKKLRMRFENNKPFPCLEIEDFFDKEYIENVKIELMKESFELKDSDLFKFFQTGDFASSKNKKIIQFRRYLSSKEFTRYISGMTGVKIRPLKISIHGTCYKDTHYLLCHDDRLDDRRLAIMIYLNDMQEKGGGALRLYNSKGKGPCNIVKEIYPKFNKMAIFLISKKSFHDVSEVLVNKDRLAVGWWYYDK